MVEPSDQSRAGQGRRSALVWRCRRALVAVVVPALSACASPLTLDAAPIPTPSVQTVQPAVETASVPNSGDAADDPAIWVDAADPSRSTVIGTDKQGGLAVYDLSGRQLQYLPVGEVNNVDIRSAVRVATSFHLGGEPVSLVTAGHRGEDSIGVYVVEPATRRLRDVAGRVIRPGVEVYGSCMYRSPDDGHFFAFVVSKSGEVEQWLLFDDGDGRVDGRLVRSFDVGGQAEGCVADDELGHLYIAEEEEGIWKYGAEPGDGPSRRQVARASAEGPLVPDVEGLTLAYGPRGSGYLIASSQGDESFAVFRRGDDNAYVSSFRIVRGAGVDGSRDTDGIDVTTTALGPDLPSGVFVAQDGRNDHGQRQNFKLVPYQDILPG